VSGVAYIDTSAFLRLFLEETDSEQVSKAVQEAEELCALRLVLTEARVTMERLRRDGRLNEEDFIRTLDALELYWETQIQVVDLSEDAYLSAEWISSKQPGLRTLDALHLGAARILRKQVRPVPVSFISCDNRQRRAALTVQFDTPISPAE
jgi:hypothetical protein